MGFHQHHHRGKECCTSYTTHVYYGRDADACPQQSSTVTVDTTNSYNKKLRLLCLFRFELRNKLLILHIYNVCEINLTTNLDSFAFSFDVSLFLTNAHHNTRIIILYDLLSKIILPKFTINIPYDRKQITLVQNGQKQSTQSVPHYSLVFLVTLMYYLNLFSGKLIIIH